MNLESIIRNIVKDTIVEVLPKELDKFYSKKMASQLETPTQKEIISIDEVVQLSSYKKQTIYAKISNGTIPIIPKKAGQKFVRFKRSEIIDWLKNGK